ncbi:unnamed protein product [Trifolium pratense]|uniref:Uncharacterized protein n=1 Tax=Trifolium pratense TaxID=57577 RepID=A0ACB0JEF9_TRIPR|nr:unnamed protein product [Trifolium pratense]
MVLALSDGIELKLIYIVYHCYKGKEYEKRTSTQSYINSRMRINSYELIWKIQRYDISNDNAIHCLMWLFFFPF